MIKHVIIKQLIFSQLFFNIRRMVKHLQRKSTNASLDFGTEEVHTSQYFMKYMNY
jgi:hypothetical protein